MCTAFSRCSTPRPRANDTVALVGRSMVRNMQIARELGLLHVRDGALIDLAEAEQLPSRRVVLVSTGSQGEPLSALSRMANREHPTVRVVPRRHDPAGLVAHPRQRERGRARDQRTVATRCDRSCTGRRRWSTSRDTRRPGNCDSSSTRSGRATSCRSTANGVICGRTPRSPGPPDCPMSASCWPRTAPSSIWSQDARPIVGRIPVGYVYVDGLAVGDIGDAALKDRRILGEEGFLSILGRRRPAGRQGRLRPGDHRPRVHRRPRCARSHTGRADHDGGAVGGGRRSRRETSSNTSSGAPSAAGSTRPTAADPCSCPWWSRSEYPDCQRRSYRSARPPAVAPTDRASWANARASPIAPASDVARCAAVPASIPRRITSIRRAGRLRTTRWSRMPTTIEPPCGWPGGSPRPGTRRGRSARSSRCDHRRAGRRSGHEFVIESAAPTRSTLGYKGFPSRSARR